MTAVRRDEYMDTQFRIERVERATRMALEKMVADGEMLSARDNKNESNERERRAIAAVAKSFKL